MKYYWLILVAILFFSCNKEEKNNFNNDLLKGNWSSLNNNTYQEYYFDSDDMYIYDPYAGNIFQFKYIIKGNSIYRYFVHPELENKNYEYYDKIIKFDSSVIDLEKKKIVKVKDSITLEKFINSKVNHDSYYESCIKRGNINVPK